MAHRISVLLVGSSEDFTETLSAKISEQEDMVLLATAEDGEEAMSLVRTLRPQVLVMDILLRKLDGVGFIKELKHSGELPHTIVVSAFFNDSIAAEISSLGASYCFPKPCRISEVINRIRDCVYPEQSEHTECSYEAEVTDALINFGVLPHLQGYRYLREAICRNINDRETLKGVTKILYPELAKSFRTTSKCIERGMRNALDAAWNNIKPEIRNAYFGELTAHLTERPTNSRFISMMTEFIIIKARRERRDGTSGANGKA